MHGRQGFHRAWLLDTALALGAEDPVTWMTTGNLALDVAPDALDALIGALEAELAGILGRTEPFIVRSLAHLEGLVDADPFAAAEAFGDIHAREVSFARAPVDPGRPLPIRSRRGDIVVFRVDGADVFSINLLVDGRASGPGGLVEALAGQPITTRGWSTVTRIVHKERARAGR